MSDNNISNEQLFEFMTKMYNEFNGKFDSMDKEMKKGFKELKDENKKTNAKIDHEIMPKIDALFYGYKQNSEKLDRIEKEVSKHEEIILRRIQ